MKQLLLFFFIYLVSFFSYSQDFIVTDGLLDNSCEGVLFDPAGPSTGVGGNQNITYTICPDDENLRMVLDFQTFNFIYPGASLIIYDGEDTTETQLFTSVGLDSGVLPFILAGETNLSGCLTLVVTTPPFVPPAINLNFSALISCEEQCASILPDVEINGDICSSASNSTQTYSTNQPIFLSGFAISENEFVPELSTFNWLIEGIEYNNQQDIEVSFENPGLYEGNLTVIDQLGCTSEILHFTLKVGDQFLLISEVNDSHTLDELIQDVLVGGANCANILNINSPNNAAISGESFESIGYFNKGCSDFPFEEGIVIGSGAVNNTISSQFSSGSIAWEGVDEMTILSGGTVGTGAQSRNATVIEFDFSSFDSEVSLNYIFGSYEYPNFTCGFSDAVAIILSGPYDTNGNLIAGTPLYPIESEWAYSNTNIYNINGNPASTENIDLGGLNVATINDQNGVPVPVSTSNIHNNFNCNLNSAGGFFYPEFFNGFINMLPNPYNSLGGDTEVLTAEFGVAPCLRYKIKIMVADYVDTLFDSYLFIEAGSFKIGSDLLENISAEENNSLCYGNQIELSISEELLTFICDLNFQWSFNGENITDVENMSSIFVTEPGNYGVFVDGENGCINETNIEVGFYPVPTYIDNEEGQIYPNIVNCFNQFDLTTNEPLGLGILQHNGVGQPIPDDILSVGDLGMEILYYESLEDAINNTNPIANPEIYQLPDNLSEKTIFIRVHENLSGQQLCEEIRDFQIVVEPFQIQEPFNLNECATEDFPFGVFDLTENDEEILSGLVSTEYEVSYFVSENEAIANENPIDNPESFEATESEQLVWVRISNLSFPDCFEVASFQLILLDENDEACDNLSVTNFATGLSIYPNPTKAILSIENLTTTAIKSVNIYTLNGKKVGEYMLDSPAQITTSINVSELGNALYLIEIISTDNEKYISKFLKH